MANEKVRFGHFLYEALRNTLKEAGVERSTEELYSLFKRIPPKTPTENLAEEIMDLLDKDTFSVMKKNKSAMKAIISLAVLSISPTFYIPEKKTMNLLEKCSEFSFNEEFWKNVAERLDNQLFIDTNINLDKKFTFVLAEGLFYGTLCISKVSHFLMFNLRGYSKDRLIVDKKDGKKVLKPYEGDKDFMQLGEVIYNPMTGSFLYIHPFSKDYKQNKLRIGKTVFEGLRVKDDSFAELCEQGFEAINIIDFFSRIDPNIKGSVMSSPSANVYPHVEYAGLLFSIIQVAQDVLSLYAEKERSKGRSKSVVTCVKSEATKEVGEVSFSAEEYLKEDMEEGLHDQYIYLDNVPLKHKRKHKSDKGKSHKSPRPHIVGGFWRTYKSGKKVFIESFPRGYAAGERPSREEAKKLKPASKQVYRV